MGDAERPVIGEHRRPEQGGDAGDRDPVHRQPEITTGDHRPGGDPGGATAVSNPGGQATSDIVQDTQSPTPSFENHDDGDTGTPDHRRSYTEINFDRMHEIARQMARTLDSNPELSRDQITNMEGSIEELGNRVNLYTREGNRIADVFNQFGKVRLMWGRYKGGEADARRRIIDALNQIAEAEYTDPKG